MNKTLRPYLLVEYYKNHLTKENSYKARPLLSGTMTNEDIARRIVKQRSEFRYETILHILSLCDQAKIDCLADGYGVIDGVYHAHPSITGRFDTAWKRLEGEYSISVTITPSPALRKTMAESEVKVTGKATVGPAISTVEDTATKTVNKSLTPGMVIKIRGRWLKLIGDDPDVGVYFVSAADPSVCMRADSRDVIDNMPKQLLVLVPALPEGDYYVEVATQYTNGRTMVKKARRHRFASALTVSSV